MAHPPLAPASLPRGSRRRAPADEPPAASGRPIHRASARAGARASVDDRLRQQPPPVRAARAAPERAGRRGAGARAPRLGRARAAPRDRGAAQGGRAARARRDQLARARHRHGRGRSGRAGRVARLVAAGLQRVGRAGHRVGGDRSARIFPKHRGDLLEARRGRAAHARRARSRRSACPQQPARRARAADRRHGRRAAVARRRAVRARRGARELPRAAARRCIDGVLDMLAGRYPSRRVRRAAAAHHLGSRARRDLGAQGARLLAVVNAGTIPDRGLFGVHLGAERAARRRAGRGDGARVAAGQTFLLGATTWRIQRDHARSRDRRARARRAGQMPFWRGEGPGRPLELGRALGAFVARARRRARRGRGAAWLQADYGLDSRAARNLVRTCGSARSDRRAAERPRHRHRAVPGRARRLARLRAVAVRRARACAVGARARARAVASASGYDVQACGATTASCCASPTATTPPAADRLLVPDPDEIEERIIARAAALGAVRVAVSRERRSRAAACRAAARASARRCVAAAARAEADGRRAAVPGVPDRAGDVPRGACRTCSTCPRCARCCAQRSRARCASMTVETPRAVAVRALARVRLRRRLPVRGRLARGRAQGAGAVARSLSAARVARARRSCASCWMPQAGGRGRGRAAGAVAGAARAQRRRGARSAAPRRRSDRGRARARASTASVRPMLAQLVDTRTRADRARGAAGALDRRRRRGAAIATRSAWRCRRASPAAFLEPAAEPLEALVARWARTHGAVHRRRREPAKRWGSCRRRSSRCCARSSATGACATASSGPAASGAERAIPRCCGRSAATRWRSCARGRARRRCGARALPAALARRRLSRAAASARCAMRSISSKASRCRSPSSSASSCPRAFPTTSRACSTSSAPRASSCGSARAPSAARTAASCSFGASASRSLVRRAADAGAADAICTARSSTHLSERGASFVGAARRDAAARPDVVGRALWDLVWVGLVTNDTFAPLRSLGRTSRGPRGRFTLPAGGRWCAASVVGATPADTRARAHARAHAARALRHRQPRGGARPRRCPAGSRRSSGVLRAMEEAGKIRRGYFVDGPGGRAVRARGAVDRLRAARDVSGDAVGPPVVTLSAIDPANPYGALLPWPAEGARRVAGAKVVLAHGEPLFFVERGGKKLRLLARIDDTLARAGAGRAQAHRGGATPPAAAHRRGRRRAGAALAARGAARARRLPHRAGRARALRRRLMPEGDNIHAHAAALSALVGRTLTGVWSRGGRDARAARTVGRARRGDRQAPGHRVRRGQRRARAPRHRRRWWRHRARASTATIAQAELALQTARGVWLCKARTLEWSRARFVAGARAWRGSAPTCSASAPDLDAVLARAREPRHAARPIGELLLDQTDRRRARQRLQVRALVPARRRSVGARRRPRRRDLARALRRRDQVAARQRRPHADDDRGSLARRAPAARARPAVGLRPLAPRLLPLRHCHRAAAAAPVAAADLLLPALSARELVGRRRELIERQLAHDGRARDRAVHVRHRSARRVDHANLAADAARIDLQHRAGARPRRSTAARSRRRASRNEQWM